MSTWHQIASAKVLQQLGTHVDHGLSKSEVIPIIHAADAAPPRIKIYFQSKSRLLTPDPNADSAQAELVEASIRWAKQLLQNV